MFRRNLAGSSIGPLLVVLVAVLGAPMPAAQAQRTGLGAFPSEIVVDEGLRGASVEATLGLINDSGQPEVVELSAAGAAGGWIAFEAPAVTVPAEGRVLVTLVVTVPSDAANGRYEATILARAPGDEVTLAIEVPVVVVVTGTQVLAGAITGLTIEPAEVGTPARFAVQIDNTGNVAFVPLLDVLVEAGSTEVDRFELTPNGIPPGRISIAGEWDTSSVLPGSYRLTVTGTAGELELGGESVAVELAERGTFTRDVELAELIVVNDPAIGGVAAIDAVAHNTGEIEAIVSLDAVLVRNGERIGSERSNPLRVASGERGTVSVFFTIAEPGSYVVSGVLDFETGRSETRSVAFGVEGAGGGLSPLWWLLLVVTVTVAGFGLAARRRQLMRLRRRLDHSDVH